MKRIFLFFIFLTLLFNISFASAQSGIAGVITNQGLQFLGLPSELQTLIQGTICASSGGVSCFGNIIKGQVTGQLLSIVAQSSPEMGKIIGVYNQLQPLIESGKVDVKQDIQVNNQGEAESGTFSIKSGETADISKFVSSDFADGSVKISGLTFSKKDGTTTFSFDKDNGFLKIGGNTFENIAADSSGNSFIKINEKGDISQASFLTNEKGGVYDFNGMKFNAPSNSKVDYKQGVLTPSKASLEVADESKVLTPEFKDGTFGTLEIKSLKDGSFYLADGTKVSGIIKYTEGIQEGFIPPNTKVIFNDKVFVTAGDEFVRLTPNVDVNYKYSSFYPAYKDYYVGFATKEGSYDINYFDGKGNIDVSLENSGVFLDLNRKEVSTWVTNGGKTDLTFGDNTYYYSSSEKFIGNPFDAIGKPELVGDYNLIGYETQDGKYVPGDTKTIKGTQEVSVLESGVEGIKTSSDKNLIQRVISDPVEAISHPIKTIKGTQVTGSGSVSSLTTQTEISGVKVLKPGDLVASSSKITSRYGYRTDPFTKEKSFHDGLDIAATAGTDIKPYQGGKVFASGFSSTLGNYVEIDNGNGLITTYAHMQSTPSLGNEDPVTIDTVIGKVGSTGRATGSHLHFSASKNRKSINPETLFK